LSERLEPLLSCPPGAFLLFDLAGLRFIDSVGIRTLLDACMRARRAGGGAAFCGLSPHLRRLFALLGLTPRLTIHPTLEVALTDTEDACRRDPEWSAPSTG
jgi:anti-anti-sigma factor